ncbi:MAG TPA: acyltransferase [Pseudobdellovibrionaceae bacterium]
MDFNKEKDFTVDKGNVDKSNLDFLVEKFKTWKFSDLIWLQWESLLLWLFNFFPALPGFVFRNFIGFCLFKEKKGFSWIQTNVIFVHTNRLKVGSHFGVNSGTYINAVGTIEIGDYVLIGSNVTISSGKHPIDGVLPPIYARPSIPSKIIIEDDVWIGAGAVIMPGVNLKKGTVVGANSVVTKSTEPYSIVVGAPARIISYRDKRNPKN